MTGAGVSTRPTRPGSSSGADASSLRIGGPAIGRARLRARLEVVHLRRTRRWNQELRNVLTTSEDRRLENKCGAQFRLTVPIVFALLLVVAGWWIANRALFDVASASGYFCKGRVAGDARKVEKIGTSNGVFRTDHMCWPSGLVLEEGRRYRIK